MLLDAVRRHPVERFVLISSSEVYGTAESDPMDEEHPLDPRSPYAATKAGGDRLVYSYVATYDMPALIIRPFNNYGPYQHPEKVVPRFITAALRDEPLTVHGDGSASRDWLSVEDDCAAIAAALHAPLDACAARRSTSRPASTSASATSRSGSARRSAGRAPDPPHRRPARPVDRHIGSTERAAQLLGWRARSASTRASSARSAGTPTTRPGGRGTWRRCRRRLIR